MSRSPQQPVYSVTGARSGASDDLAQRQRRYLISMAFRTACFPLAVVTHGWLRWSLVAVALVLPYIAVVMANAVGSRAGDAPTVYVPQQAALGSAERDSLGGARPGRPAPDASRDKSPDTSPDPVRSTTP